MGFDFRSGNPIGGTRLQSLKFATTRSGSESGVSEKGSKKRKGIATVSIRVKRRKLDKPAKLQCSAILGRLMSHPVGWVFSNPVDPVRLNIPDYLSVISKPMDLGTIKANLEKDVYLRAEDFAADVRLTFSNAMLYNPPSNGVHLMARTLSEIFDARWKSQEGEISKAQNSTGRTSCGAISTKSTLASQCGSCGTVVSQHRVRYDGCVPTSTSSPGNLSSEIPLGQRHAASNVGEGVMLTSAVRKSDSDGAVSSLDEEYMGNGAGFSTASAATKESCALLRDIKLSPEKALRAATLKFADTIVKAQPKTEKLDDPVKMRQEKERLNREYKARIKAAKAAMLQRAEAKVKIQRQREREAARIELLKIKKTVELDNLQSLQELEVFIACSPFGRENSLEQLGLFLRKDDMEDEDEHLEEAISYGDVEEGEILY
ncbi:hypothetical protein RJ640_014960 [Escallonia rubra]|uniref:Bromo domain-containing protein n=1 Tax=Escallonia rubra TaxID=112253 RepID=A0AA88UVJ0_9ASTE|nr:hypothetical protein RJ640_014960 [Escallonia rubra]